LVTAGAGGVGSYCLQLIRLWRENLPTEYKEKVKILTTCSQKNFEFVKQLGATHPIDYNTENVVEKAKQLTNGYGVDAWIDNVGADSTAQGLKALAYGGELVVVVSNADYKDALFSLALTVHNVSLGWGYMSGVEYRIKEVKEIGDIFLQLYEEGKIVSEVTKIKLEQVKEELERIR